MKHKLVHRLALSADQLDKAQLGVETDLRARLLLSGSAGIAGVDDVDTDGAPCALVLNLSNSLAFDVVAGDVVFPNGETVRVATGDITGVAVSAAAVDAVVVRLEYGTVEDGDIVANPYSTFAARPGIRMRTPAEMVVTESVAAYSAQPAPVLEKSVVLGVVRVEAGALVLDNTRATYSFARPWFSYRDHEHRSKVGSGAVTETNPHGTSATDLSVGNFTLWQALVPGPSRVIAKVTDVGRIPGELCRETIPSGAFVLDSTGEVTGCAGARYAPLGSFPERLTRVVLTATNNEVAAWVPRGRNVVAIFDPARFAAPATVDVYFTRVLAASLPTNMNGRSALDLVQPTADELITAGGNMLAALNETRVLFTDVGMVPMFFDVRVGADGKPYKSPDVVYCNTRLDTIGTVLTPLLSQPRAPARLRLALTEFNPGFTSVQVRISGVTDTGASVTETLTFSGIMAAPTVSYVENEDIRLFSANVYASASIQIIARVNDGPNTALTVMAEDAPSEDDLLVGTVFWTGSGLSALPANTPLAPVDRRVVHARGLNVGPANQPGLVDSVLGAAPAGSTVWATIVEDFDQPQWLAVPHPNDATATTPSNQLSSAGGGLFDGYISRRIPFAVSIPQSGMDAVFMRFLPRGSQPAPVLGGASFVTVTLHRASGADVVLTGTVSRPYAPYQVSFAGGPIPSGDYFAATVTIPRRKDMLNALSGYLLHVRA